MNDTSLTGPRISSDTSNPKTCPEPMADQAQEEINLLDLFLVLIKRKWLITGIVVFAGAAAVFISLNMRNIYRSEATIILPYQEGTESGLSAFGGFGGILAGQLGAGGGGSLQKLEVVLKSKNLSQRIILNNNLLPLFFFDVWDSNAKKWTIDPAPTIQDGIKYMLTTLKVNTDIMNGTINVAFDHIDPETAKKIVDYYLIETSNILREQVLKDAAENMRFLIEQINRTSDSLLKEKIYTMLAKEIEKDTFARARNYYGFQLLDPPLVPDLNKKVAPRRALICILSVFVAFFLSVFLAFFLEYMHRIKKEDSKRYHTLIQGLKFWRFRSR